MPVEGWLEDAIGADDAILGVGATNDGKANAAGMLRSRRLP